MELESFKKMPNPEQLKKGGIGAAVGVALWAVLYFLALSPILSAKSETAGKIAVARDEYRKNQALVKQAGQVEEDYEKVRQQLLGIMDSKLVPSDSARSPLTWIGGIIQDMAEARGLKVQNLSNAGRRREEGEGRNAPPPIFEEYLINLELVGGYHEFGRFIADLETKLSYAKIDNVRLRPVRGDDQKLAIVMKYGIPAFTDDGFPPEQRPQRSDTLEPEAEDASAVE